MKVLVTRPLPAGERLVAELQAIGYQAWSMPLIAFSAGRELQQLPLLLQSTEPGDLGLVLSQHAVYHANHLLNAANCGWPSHLHWLAIGQTTARAFTDASGIAINYPKSRETSEVLLQLPELQNIRGKRALILRGNGGRELLGQTLTARGAQVHYCECYYRSPCHYQGSDEAKRWQKLGVDTLVITSGEMLEQMFALIPAPWRANWLLRCRLVVVSPRLAEMAHRLGWQTITVADNADNDALLRALHHQHE